jgi:uncharacterized membrane protein YfcA
MQEMEVTFGRAAIIWWAWIWRTMLLTILTSLAIGALVGVLEHALLPEEWRYGDPEMLLLIGRICGGLLGSLISIRVMQKTLKRRFHGFRIALIKHQEYYTEPF